MAITVAANTDVTQAHLTAARQVDDADRIPFVARVADYAGAVLRPGAVRADTDGVPAERAREFADIGLLNHLAPKELGGQALDRAGDRRVHEIISGACFNTWLIWAQHAPVVGRLAKERARGVELSSRAHEVLTGRVLVGAAISDVRRFPDHFVEATRVTGGWRLNGTVSWFSGWGLNSAVFVAAVEPSTRTVVTSLVPIDDSISATRLGLSALGGSHTLRVHLRDVQVDDADVVSRQSVDDWLQEDVDTVSDARSQHFGLAHRVLDELRAEHEPSAREVAARWAPRVAQIRADAYGLSDEAIAAGTGPYRTADRLAVKVASGEALSALTRALVIARSGHGIGLDDTAQLHARSALFVLVQGQNVDVRRAQLAHLIHSPAATNPEGS
ncbi:acyl-CoA dehydrogenase family protein [Gordonia sp. NPDC003376]